MKNFSTKRLLKSKQINLEFQANPKKYKKYYKIKYNIINSAVSSKFGGTGLHFTAHMSMSPAQILVLLKLLKPKLKDAPRSRVALPILKVDTVVTKKPKDIRMGRGKGVPSEKKYVTNAGSPAFFCYKLTMMDA